MKKINIVFDLCAENSALEAVGHDDAGPGANGQQRQEDEGKKSFHFGDTYKL